ncbi:MAG: hypothetical protein OSB57_02660 [Planctomycetota bacterium]|nr:hypothetical protein [Planctomycetota bacterium]
MTRSKRQHRTLTLLLCATLWVSGASGASLAWPGSGLSQDEAQDELEGLLQAERAEADQLRRRGRGSAARRRLSEMLEDDPTDAAARRIMAACKLDQGHHGQALVEAQRALADAMTGGDRHLSAACARLTAEVLGELGRHDEALALLLGEHKQRDGSSVPLLDTGNSAQDAWALGDALKASGDRDASRRVLESGLEVRRDASWGDHLAAGRCAHALGRLTLASKSFVRAERVARAGEGSEPDVLAALAALYFESEREVEASGKRSAADLYREALELHPTHAPSLLGLFELHRYNRQRVSRSPEDILRQLLGAVPDSISGRVAKVSADLTDGRLKAVRADLEWLQGKAPLRRDVRTLRSALAWVEHDREMCEQILAQLSLDDPSDSSPERGVGGHLISLYRFSEALPFLRRAVERDDGDWDAWRLLGQALANTGDEREAALALAHSEKVAGGRQDALRKNLSLVLGRMATEQVVESHGSLEFAWQPQSAEVLRTYLVPFYLAAREDLAQRYGHTAGATRIEVFRAHRDFSVRSVGFEGFPALGVCFGPVVTALSPLSEMRGRFSWARTGFHEFSHVVHLGLSHNRCPRWITEGLATWEEVRRNPAWTRNMRRELLDTVANGDLIRVRDLNRAFRGPRILFGYYQGGLLCEMLIDAHGFGSMVHLLEEFDRGADLDQALGAALGETPENVDEAFELFVRGKLKGLRLEPRWDPQAIVRLRLRLKREPPEGDRAEWIQRWLDVAWGSWQRGRRVDAEEALRIASLGSEDGPRALALRGEMALARALRADARAHWEASVEAGGRDYRALMGLASLCQQDDDLEDSERYLLMAQASFPGYDSPSLSAERQLNVLYKVMEKPDLAAQALERWLTWNAGAYTERLQVAQWHREAGRFDRAATLYGEANEVDPFRRDLHLAWAEVLVEEERWKDALREFGVGLIVPPDVDLDHQRFVGPPGGLPRAVDPEHLPALLAQGMDPELREGVPLTAEEQRAILNKMGECARAMGDEGKAAEYAERALALGEGS